MASPKPRSSARTTSLRDSEESERLEATSSWEALEWFKIEVRFSISILGFISQSSRCLNHILWFCFAQPVSRSVSNVNLDFLLEAEELIVEVRPMLA
jgi:hypothetical protein